MPEQDLGRLLFDEEARMTGLLSGVLEPYVQIGKNSGVFAPTPEFQSLDTTQQTAVALLYQRAASELDFVEGPGASPREIADSTGINHNSVKTAVRKLDDTGLVQNDDGVYTIPPHSLPAAEDLIRGG